MMRDTFEQLLGGMEKVAGDVAYRHLRKDLSLAKRSFQFIQNFYRYVTWGQENAEHINWSMLYVKI